MKGAGITKKEGGKERKGKKCVIKAKRIKGK